MRLHQAVRLEGGLFGPDFLACLASGELAGQKPSDFGLPARRSLVEEAAAIFSEARTQWQLFLSRQRRLPETDLGTRLTRDGWMIPFLSALGYELVYHPRAFTLDGLTFAISHRAGLGETAPPVHIVGFRQELGRVAASGRPRLSPHALVQEYLNRSDALWGLVTNGLVLRLLRDSTLQRRQAYVEFDLVSIFEEERFDDFQLLYRLLHRSRLPRDGEPPEECLLERYFQWSEEQGGRVRDRLRDGVEECLVQLANGFLQHPASSSLRAWCDEHGAEALYGQLLRLVYRLLFLLVAEQRGLMGHDRLYLEHYGASRLRRLAENRLEYSEEVDLWHGLRALWRILADEQLAARLGVPPLNGQLFEPLVLDEATITNRELLSAFWHLAFYREQPTAPPRAVNYAALDTEELGSVYESLLDYQPTLESTVDGRPQFCLAPGGERKSTGSYYTPPELVNELVTSALEPVIAERLAAAPPGRRVEALLSIKVLDPASGSGHFLLAAARRLAKAVAQERTGEEEPAPEALRQAMRDVVAHCIYAVDKNPLAVELARVALWLESHAEGKPLTMLEHRVKCGDSLLGIIDPRVIRAGIPDGAFSPIVDDDRATARRVQERNETERCGQLPLFVPPLGPAMASWRELVEAVEAQPDDTPEQVRTKERLYERLRVDEAWQAFKRAADAWTAAFFQRYAPGQPAITSQDVQLTAAGQPSPTAELVAEPLAERLRFFHWPLEFPEVFARPGHSLAGQQAPSDEAVRPSPSPGEAADGSGQREPPSAAVTSGFDVVLGNPPWGRIKLEEQVFFARYDARIARAANAAARKRLIAALERENPALWALYRQALRDSEALGRFLRASGDYPLTARGDINSYSVFAERMRRLLAPGGRAGLVVPTGIATDATNQHFFASLVDGRELASLYDFENRQGLFPAIDSRLKFCLLSLRRQPEPRPLMASDEGQATAGETGGQKGRGAGPAGWREPAGGGVVVAGGQRLRLAFFLHRAEQLRDQRRVFELASQDIGRLNPNTRTLPLFRTRQDAELTRAMYERVPVLKREGDPEGDPWRVRFLRMFDMANDSHLFRTRQELESRGYRLVGNRMLRSTPGGGVSSGVGRSRGHGSLYLPLYEAKMLWHFDHRYASYEGVADRSSTHLPQTDEARHADPSYLIQPWYWVPASEVRERLGEWQRGWLVGWRDVTNATNERTVVSSALGAVGVGDKFLLILPGRSPTGLALLLGEHCSLAHDFCARQKVAGVSLKYFTKMQLPTLPPSAYSAADLGFVVPRVLELVYTAWDMKPFADDVWAAAASVELAAPAAATLPSAAPSASPQELPRPWADPWPPGGAAAAASPNPLARPGSLQELLFAQWLANRSITGGVPEEPPPWLEAYPEVRLPPGWPSGDDARRWLAVAEQRGPYQLAEDRAPRAGGLQPVGLAPAPPELPAAAELKLVSRAPKPTASPHPAADGICPFPPFKWDEARRATLRAELDAYYARLYGLGRKQLRYILDPADLTPGELADILDPDEEVADPLDPAAYAARAAASDFPSETFRVLKEKELRLYGEYRTRRLVLEAWQHLFGGR